MCPTRPIAIIIVSLAVGLCNGPPVFASDQDALIVGMFPRRNADQTKKLFTPLFEYLGAKLGRKLSLEVNHDFQFFWDNVAKQRYHLVHYNQYHYVRSHKEYGYRLILKNEEFGRSVIAGSLVVRKDSGISSIRDLKGKKVIFGGGKTAMQSYIVAKYLLQRAGLMDGDYTSQFALNPPRACIAVYYRQGAAAGVGDGILGLPLVREEIDVSEMKILTQSEPLAHLPWAVRKDVSHELMQKIQAVLVELKNTKPGRALLEQGVLTGLLPATDSEYDPHRRIIYHVTGEQY